MSERSERIMEHGATARSAGAVIGAPPVGPSHAVHADAVHQ